MLTSCSVTESSVSFRHMDGLQTVSGRISVLHGGGVLLAIENQDNAALTYGDEDDYRNLFLSEMRAQHGAGYQPEVRVEFVSNRDVDTRVPNEAQIALDIFQGRNICSDC